MFKAFLCLTTAFSVLLNGGYRPAMTEIDRVPSHIEAVKSAKSGAVTEGDIISVTSEGQNETYENRLHGYKITVPYGFKPDSSLAEIRLRLDSGSQSIDIYKESFSSRQDCYTYISYSNRFTSDTENYTIERDEDIILNGREAHVIKWTRAQLGLGDKNHYANIDIIDKTDVYSIMIKSASELTDYMDIASSFTLTEPTLSAGIMSPFSSESKTVMNEETSAAYSRIFGGDSLSWGLFIPTQPVEGMSKYADVERSIGINTEICLFYSFVTQKYDPSLIGNPLRTAWDSGKICELTLQLSPTAESGFVFDILKGKYDGFFNDFAADVKDFGHPVLLRLFNEMNGEWCNYSGYHTSRDPEVYIMLYKYVYNKFKSAGAENIIWVWNPNEKSFPNFLWNSEELYYPGGAYVDVVGLTGYNTGTYYEGEKWRSFDRIYKNIYEKADLLYGKPMMITEFSCSTTGGNKEEWVRDMFASLADYPNIKAAVWWSGRDLDPSNGNVARSYYIDDTEGVMAVFRENLSKK